MFRAIKSFLLVPVLMLSGGYSVFGFALAGPIGFGLPAAGDTWQTTDLGYGLATPNYNIDLVAPKNLGEQYRWDTKNIYYSFDPSFSQYYGTNGMAAVDAAFAILNSLSNVDSYTTALSEWPLKSSRFNFTAANAGLLDVKSYVLIEMMEQLGLAEPDRWTFCLHDRDLPAGNVCPNYDYNVIQRNFDPVTQNYSTYVNGVLYTFIIIESCPNPPAFANLTGATTENVPVDPEQVAEGLSAVAAGQFGGIPNAGDPSATLTGKFYTGLTRDDVGGFRYLYSTNTIVDEQVSGGALQLPGASTIVLTSNLAQLQSDSLTNGQTALQALYPTLQITGQTTGSGTVFVTNFILVTNPPPAGSVAGTPPTIILEPQVSSQTVQTFAYTFGNVITNFTYTNGGVLVTNTPNEYLLVPSNQCGFSILSNALTLTLTTTNTNTLAVTTFTSHALVVNIFSCFTNAISVLEGTEKLNFFRIDYDSLVSSTFAPFTNTWTLTAVSNNRPFAQTYNRVVTRPDILFTAQDIQTGPTGLTGVFISRRSRPNFVVSVIQTNNSQLGGPGTISYNFPSLINGTNLTITLDKTGPIFSVSAPAFQIPIGPGNTNLPDFQWASFDGSTNAPVVYPVNTDYQNLVNNIFLQITTPGSLPTGIVNQSYSTLLTASGATPPPYFYTNISGSLPSGLNFVTAGGNTTIAGTPMATGIFDFVLSVTDTSTPARTSYRNFAIEIDPQ
jgi:hypothetical protein